MYVLHVIFFGATNRKLLDALLEVYTHHLEGTIIMKPSTGFKKNIYLIIKIRSTILCDYLTQPLSTLAHVFRVALSSCPLVFF